MVAQWPEFLDGYAHIGASYHLDGDVQQAKIWYQRGSAIAATLLPPTFQGQIRWGYLGNRSFLRLHHGLILSALNDNEIGVAIELMEAHLQWNPDDNLGVRFMIGDAYLAMGKMTKAKKVLTKGAAQSPPCRYSLAFWHLRKGDYVKAATELRRAIVANPYVAEVLLGNPEPRLQCRWHGTSLEMPAEAKDYVSMLGQDIWDSEPEALEFLNWLVHSSAVQMEVAAIRQTDEALTYERDVNKRMAIGDRRRELTATIDDRLSRDLVRQVPCRRLNESCWPWDPAAYA